MSGPKSSSYSLTRNVMAQLERERARREAAIKETSQRYYRNIEELKRYCREVAQQQMPSWAKSVEQAVNEARRQCIKAIESLCARSLPRSSEAINSESRRIMDEFALIKKTYLAQIDHAQCIAELIMVRQTVANYLDAELDALSTDNIMAATVTAINRIKRKYVDAFDSLCAKTIPSEPETIRRQASSIKDASSKLQEEFAQEIAGEQDKLSQSAASQQRVEWQQKLGGLLSTIGKEQTVQVTNISLGEDDSEVLAEAVRLASYCLEQAGQLINTRFLPREKKQQLETLVSTIYATLNAQDVLNKDKAAKLQKHIRTYYFLEKVLQKHVSDFDRAYQLYVEECLTAGVESREKRYFRGVAHLEAEILEVREADKARRTREYVMKQVDEVMQEQFNYKAVESQLLEEMRDGTRELYEFDRDSAINVLISDNGTVMMEVVATGPEGDLSKNEKKMMVRKQEQLCELYPEIIRELKKRGVVFAKRKHQPPHIDFVKKIVTKAGRGIREGRQKEEKRTIIGGNDH